MTLKRYKRGTPPAFPESQPKYLQDELTKVEEILDQAVEVTDTLVVDGKTLSASVTHLTNVVTTADYALAQTIDTLSATVTVLGTTVSATIVDEQTARATADEALAKSIKTLTASVKTNLAESTAQIVQESTVRATANEAYARVLTTLSASTGNNTAKIREEITARTTLTDAYATRITTLETATGGVTAAQFNDQITTRTNAETAIASRTTTLEASVNDPATGLAKAQASITAINNVSASSTSSAASSIYTVQSRLNNVGGGASTIEQTFNTQANTLTGYGAKYGVTVNSNNQISGFSLNSSASGSDFSIAADKFAIYAPGTTTNPKLSWNTTTGTLVVAGDIYANNFYGNVIGNSNIITGSVAAPISVTAVTRQTGSGVGSYKTMIEGYITLDSDGIVYAIATMGMAFPAGSRSWGISLQFDNATVNNIGGAAFVDSPSLSWSKGLTAGTHKVSILWYGQDSTVAMNTCSLFILGTKK